MRFGGSYGSVCALPQITRSRSAKVRGKELDMKKRILATVMAVAMVLTMGIGAMVASAADFSECNSGNTGIISISNCSNTLYYRNPHGNFKLRIYVSSPLFVSTKYSISMYDNAGRCVWSAENQGDRAYDIGGNVTRIATKTNASVGPTLYWQRK
jgi:hypothetical protein